MKYWATFDRKRMVGGEFEQSKNDSDIGGLLLAPKVKKLCNNK